MGPGAGAPGPSSLVTEGRETTIPHASFPHLVGSEMPEEGRVTLQDREIIYRETGSYTLFPAQTVRNAERVLGKIGVDTVEQIDARYTDGIPIVRVNRADVKAKCHRQACHWAAPPTPLNNPPRECFGKGMTPDQSRASAMMEAVERYCAQRFEHSGIVYAGFEQIRKNAIDLSVFKFPDLPVKCENCLEADYDCYQDLAKVAQEWTWGYSLLASKAVLVPAALVYYPYISDDYISFIFNDTGGLSAGNTIEEAILQGIAEVIERDALYYAFNLDRLNDMPRVDLKNITNGYVRQFLELLPPEAVFAYHIRNSGWDLPIATFSAFICYQIKGQHLYFGGSGTSLDPTAALLRALTELQQQKVRQKIFFEFDSKNLVLHEQTGLIPFNSVEQNLYKSTSNVKEDIAIYLDMLGMNRMDVIVVNLYHPDIGIPVVRVIIPQMISYSGSPIKESVFSNAIKHTVY